MVDTKDLKSFGQKWPCGFESRSGHGAASPAAREVAGDCTRPGATTHKDKYICARAYMRLYIILYMHARATNHGHP